MTPNTRSPAYVVLYAALTSAVFTGAIMTLHTATAQRVERNEKLARYRALVDVFNLGDPVAMADQQIIDLVNRRVAGNADEALPNDLRRRPIRLTDPADGSEIPVWIAYATDLPPDAAPAIAADPNISAYAFPISGVGFWATIDGILAVTPDLRQDVGVVFVSHSETPGLGGRIATERAWREQFAKTA